MTFQEALQADSRSCNEKWYHVYAAMMAEVRSYGRKPKPLKITDTTFGVADGTICFVGVGKAFGMGTGFLFKEEAERLAKWLTHAYHYLDRRATVERNKVSTSKKRANVGTERKKET